MDGKDIKSDNVLINEDDTVNPRAFMESCPQVLKETLLIKPESEDEIIKNIVKSTGMTKETVEELARICGKNTLYEDGEEVQEKRKILQLSSLPKGFNIDLECVKHQLWHRKLRKKSSACKVTLHRSMRYSCLDEYMTLSSFQVQDVSPEFKVPTPNIILAVQVTKCMMMGMLSMKMKERETYLVLGCQFLSELRDKIKCTSDAIIPGDYSSFPDVDPSNLQRAGDIYKSSCFFIENIFYNDTRLPDNTDYSRPIIDWAKDNMPNRVMTTAHMQSTKFFDLKVKLGHNYLFLHQGNCEHAVVFTDLRLLSASDNQDVRAYPILSVSRLRSRAICQSCIKFSAKWVVRGSPIIPTDPTFLCSPCFKSLMYTSDGKKTSNFQAYHLSQFYA